MSTVVIVVLIIVGLAVGIALGFVLSRYVINKSAKEAADKADKLMDDAKRQAEATRKEALIEAHDQALQIKQEADADARERHKEVKEAEARVLSREESLDRRSDSLIHVNISFHRRPGSWNIAQRSWMLPLRKPMTNWCE